MFYVAVTRAEKYLYISFAKTRYKFGSLQFCEPSRFLKEIPKELLEFRSQQQGNKIEKKESQHKTGLNLKKKTLIRRKQSFQPNATSDPNFVPSKISDIKEGCVVMHQRFGKGKVESVSGEGVNKMAHINFETVGSKKLILKFAKLKVL